METPVKNDLGGAAQKYRGTNRYHDQRDWRGSARRLDRKTVQGQADGGCRDDGNARGKRQWNAGLRHENSCHSTQHHELALREIDDVGRLVYQCKPERDQRVDGADGQAREDELKQLGHRVEGLTMLGLSTRRPERQPLPKPPLYHLRCRGSSSSRRL